MQHSSCSAPIPETHAAELFYGSAMSSQQVPTDPPPSTIPSREDRETFVRRVRERLGVMRQSSRWLEEQADLATGTLSKLRTGSGRVKLTPKKLLQIATVLDVSPEVLVKDTCFAELFLLAPPSPDSERTGRLAAEVDELRAELAARVAALSELQERAVAREAELVSAQADVRRLLEESNTVRKHVARRDEEAVGLQAALAEARRVSNEARAEVVAVASRFGEVSSQCERWRNHALERERRVTQLEEILVQVEQQAEQRIQELRKRPHDQTGGLIVGALLGLGLGSSGSSGRRRG